MKIGDLPVLRIVEAEGAFAPIDFLLPDFDARLLKSHSWLQPAFVNDACNVMMSFHSFVIRTGKHVIFVDGCAGNDKERPLRPSWHRQKGDFLARLAASGVQPEEIDIVFCTHLHADHVGWNTQLRDGRWVPTFPNARYLFSKVEYEYWEREHREALAAGGPAPNHGSFADSVLPVMDAKQAHLVSSDHEIEHGLHLEPAPGHTPGTCLLHVKNRGAHGIFCGDVMHTPVQLADPMLSSRFCSDAKLSARTRRSLCERVADTPTVLFTGHFPAPSAARIVRAGDAFAIGSSDAI
jgi:glyoxylase-like metal-dependent hydrolase (beta-lactamase superfamily II)